MFNLNALSRCVFLIELAHSVYLTQRYVNENTEAISLCTVVVSCTNVTVTST